MSAITRRYDMPVARITSTSDRFTGQCRRTRDDKSRLRFGRRERFKSKAITHCLSLSLSYPVNRRAGGACRPREVKQGLLTVRSQVINLIAAALCGGQFRPRCRSARDGREGSEESRRDRRLPRYTAHLDAALCCP